MTGYRGAAASNSYYRTGDVATRDEDGYITSVGRTDDVFKASDYRISPFELESVLIEHEAVAEAAIIPSPDPTRLAVPKAYVTLAPGHAPTRDTALSILRFTREHLAPYKRIRRLEFGGLPKTISGKIRRVELRHEEDARPVAHGSGRTSDARILGGGLPRAQAMSRGRASDLEYQSRVEAFDRLVRVAARITHHPRAAHRDVDAAVGVAVDPQRDPVGAHEPVRSLTKAPASARHTGSVSAPRGQRRVMGDDDGRSVMWRGQPVLQPAAAGPVQTQRVVRPKGARCRGPRDVLVVVDEVTADRHRAVALLRAADLEVAPQRAAEEPHPADHDSSRSSTCTRPFERGRGGP